MIPKNVCVLAGVSGGGDSMTMLHMLSRLSREWGFSLKAVHVHHGIRGEEADRDAAMTEKICRQWGIPFICRRFDVPALALRWKCGTEEAGRVVRQKVFQEEGALLGERITALPWRIIRMTWGRPFCTISPGEAGSEGLPACGLYPEG